MPVFKNESNGTWYVMARYVNWKGERKQKCKRGFSTKKEAQEWERMFQLQNSSDMDMSFEAFQKVREVGGDNYSYANDYQIMARLKSFADAHGLCLLLVHHTRKQNADDKFDMISGTSGLLGAADGAFLLQKEKRTGNAATLEVSGRDQQDQKLYLIRNTETLLWDLQKAETELWKEPPEPLLDEIAELVMKDNPYWEGSPTALVALINMDIQPHVITRKLNVLAGRLYTEHGILFRSERVHEGRKLRFWKDNTENA